MSRPRDFTLTDTLRPAASVTSRPIDSGVVLLNVSTGACCELNELGERVCRLLSGGATLGQVFDELIAEYDVTPVSLERDLSKLVSDLLAAGMLERT